MLAGGDIKGNGPEPVGCTCASDENCVLFDDLDIVLGEECNTIVIAELSQGYKSTGLEIIEDKSRLCLGAETGGQWEDTTEGGGHDSTAGGKDLWTIRNRSGMEEMGGVGTGDESTSGTRIKNDLRWGWAIYC
jgi:hypothetical protein